MNLMIGKWKDLCLKRKGGNGEEVQSLMYNWAKENNKIDESQAGFRKGYPAVDNIFCLQAIV